MRLVSLTTRLIPFKPLNRLTTVALFEDGNVPRNCT
jgi:hypothetical protein